MDETRALGELPETYRKLLELHRAGRSPDEVAGLLGIDREAVASMTTIAHAKLARLTDGT